MVTDCESALRASELFGGDFGEYQRFADECLDQDSRALVYARIVSLHVCKHPLKPCPNHDREYAQDLVRQGCDVDLVDPSGSADGSNHGHRLNRRRSLAEAKTGLATITQTDESTCPWDKFDGVLHASIWYIKTICAASKIMSTPYLCRIHRPSC